MHPSKLLRGFGVGSAALFILTSSAPAQVQQKRSAMRGHIDRRGGADTRGPGARRICPARASGRPDRHGRQWPLLLLRRAIA